MCLPQAIQAKTWIVGGTSPTAVSTIQAAIDSSKDGDIVLVEAGEYLENLNLRGKAIHLRSRSGPESTIINGSSRDSSVIVCRSGEDNRTIIDGFTITGGRGSTPPRTLYGKYAGGILCGSSHPTIRNNIITGNTAFGRNISNAGRGGGIYFGGSGRPGSVVVEDNVITNNGASNGGGLEMAGPGIVRGNLFEGNWTGHGDGAAIYRRGGDGPQIIDGNTIINNIAGDHGGGILIYNDGSNARSPDDIVISTNVIIGNISNTTIAYDCSGGGIWLKGGATVTANTVAFNMASSVVWPAAGGICIQTPNIGTIVERNLVYRNVEGGIVVSGSLSGPWLRDNLVFMNGSVDLETTSEALFQENVFVDPLFCVKTKESDGFLAGVSPALHHPNGPIGAVQEAGCAPFVKTPVRTTSWGMLKVRYGASPAPTPGRGSK